MSDVRPEIKYGRGGAPMREMQVEPLPKPIRLKKNGHAIGCKCRPCIGARNRRSGLRKQRDHLKALAKVTDSTQVYRSQFSDEEHAGLNGWQVEIKSGASLPKLLLRAFRQAEVATATGSGRKPAVILQPPGGEHLAVVVLKVSDFRELLSALQGVSDGS